MTQDEIIEMARQQKFILDHKTHVFWDNLFMAFAVADLLFILCAMCLEVTNVCN